MTATFYVGDAIEVMSKLPEKSVDLILTSPPFLALRSYLPADHPDKAKEGGSQSTPGEFIDWLLDVVEACDRVLAPHGSLCIELGDTYAGSGGAGGDYNPEGLRNGQPIFTGSGKLANYNDARGNPDGMRDTTFSGGNTRTGGGTGWPLAKSLSLIPESFRFAMVYGFNPHTGRTTEPWRLRNVIRWVRPNPPVGALGDKFRPATSELMVFCKSAKRYFDLDAVREPHQQLNRSTIHWDTKGKEEEGNRSFNAPRYTSNHPAGAPPLDWWKIADPGWCDFGWGPCPGSYGSSHCCRKQLGHDGFHICDLCGSRKKSPDKDSRQNPDVQAAGAPPLDWWNIPLLEGEEETRYGPKPRDITKGIPNKALAHSPTKGNSWGPDETKVMFENPLGAPPLDWWNIPPGGYEGAHYAVFPPELCIKPIKAMCPSRVCRVCGEPSRRIVGEAEYVQARDGLPRPDKGRRSMTDESLRYVKGMKQVVDGRDNGMLRVASDLGFSDCGHDDWRPGLVLDPFAGSGTTLAVATGHGRDAIGIDLDERNFDLALERVGPFILERAR